MDFPTAIKDKKAELKDLWMRMDDDADLVNLKDYVLKDVQNKAIKNAISVTLNDPAVFAANVESALGNAIEQVGVESEDKGVDCHDVEEAVKASLASASYRLMKKGYPYTLNTFIDQAMCRRGGCLARVLCYYNDKGELVIDVTPWDRRYAYYWMGSDGLDAAAYETMRLKDDIEAEYPKEKYPLVPNVGTKGAEVIDGWDGKQNTIYIGGKKIDERENSYTPGSPPVVVQLVPMGSILVAKDSRKNEGESIFFLIRGIVPELNRLMSVIQSLNQKEVDHALTWPSEAGLGSSEVPTHDDLTRPGNVIPVDKGMRPEPIALGKLQQQAWLIHQKLDAAMQKGSLSAFEYGTFTQPMSAVALIQVGEGRDQVFLPRLGARGLMLKQISYMIIEQLIGQKESTVEVGVKGHKRSIQVAKLKGEYDIEFNYYIKSPKIDAARWALAGPAWGHVPTLSIYRDILQREDPEGDLRDLYAEQAEEVSPVILMHRRLMALVEQAEDGDENAAFEAELLKAQIKAMVGQAGMPQLPEGKKGRPAGGEGKPIVDIFSEKSAAQPADGSAKEAANLEKTPAEEK
jgi:hypothetical protein